MVIAGSRPIFLRVAPITKCRRRTKRSPLPQGATGVVEFGYPTPRAHPCSMVLRDISASGLSFILRHELPGIEVGRTLEKLTVRLGRHTVCGDLVVMHLTPDETPGSICGGLFHPSRDSDILSLRRLVAELENRPPDVP
jgi:hypothetical protein